MAKKKKTSKASKKAAGKQKKETNEGETKEKIVSTLDEVEAMSCSDEEPIEENNKAWNAKAQALRAMLEGGAYDKLITNGKVGSENDEDDDDSIEEVVLGDGDDDDDDFQKKIREQKKGRIPSQAKDDHENSEEEADNNHQDDSENGQIGHEENDTDSSDEEEEEDEETSAVFDSNSKAMSSKTAQLLAEKKHFPWAERFDVVPSEPLPFGKTDEVTGSKIDIHDDLRREVAFYNVALEAVQMAREKCKESGVPFARPDDFFAEMVKSDDHMARVKDRLIFENKKIEAVAQRKSNREQKLRSKEAHSNKIAEKARRQRENMKFVDDWAKTAASNRGGRYNDQDDQNFLRKMQGNNAKGPNKKRIAANKKYGFGGKRGRFKQNDPKSMNDMSAYNPRGNFGGKGTKRQGKRARDASRKRQKTS